MTWVTTVTRNLLVDHFRKSKQDRATDSMDEPTSAEDDSLSLSDQIQDQGPSPTSVCRPAKLSRWCSGRYKSFPPNCGRR